MTVSYWFKPLMRCALPTKSKITYSPTSRHYYMKEVENGSSVRMKNLQKNRDIYAKVV